MPIINGSECGHLTAEKQQWREFVSRTKRLNRRDKAPSLDGGGSIAARFPLAMHLREIADNAGGPSLDSSPGLDSAQCHHIS
jgi:hypothetical protein